MSRTIPILFGFVIFTAALPLSAQQEKGRFSYKLSFVEPPAKEDRDDGLYIKFKVGIELHGQPPENTNQIFHIVVEENKQVVTKIPVQRPAEAKNLSVVLAMDISGSMNEDDRLKQARAATDVFLARLPSTTETGLILFNHELYKQLEPPTAHGQIRLQIDNVEAKGGTAYFDATAAGVEMLEKFETKKFGRDNKSDRLQKAVVLLTDGVDLNSTRYKLASVIKLAKATDVRVYTIGIGQAGQQKPVTSMLVLDKSGSMSLPASSGEKRSKLEAMKGAAKRFIKGIGGQKRSGIVTFSNRVTVTGGFTNEEGVLRPMINQLVAHGETKFFDAVFTAIGTLEADGQVGKRAVIALTDGRDNLSRRRKDEVIFRATSANIPLYMLGFGRADEIDEATMREMADKTGGEFFLANDEKKLLELFEKLSIKLHDHGIDEASLKKIANETGGQYKHAKEAGDLRIILESIAKDFFKDVIPIEFKSLYQTRDGTNRSISLKLVDSQDNIVSNQAGGDYQVEQKYQTRGVVPAEMNPFVYFFFLAILGVLIMLPAMLRKTPAR